MPIKLKLATAAALLALTLSGCSDRTAGLPDFTELVEKNAPAVVNISTTVKEGSAGQSGGQSFAPFPDGSSLGDLFKHFFGMPDQDDGEGEGEGSLGSGFILDREGYILTNQHVIADADQIVVRLPDRRELLATIVGQDPSSDIALLKVDAGDLPTVKVGNADKLRVGEWVLAIGTPFGFDHSVTAGIVSAKGRGIPNDSNQTYVPFIQSDVAINPGNSGGPLLNMRGEVVGINAQIYTESGGYMGLSFAIPINMAMDVVSQIKKHGHVSRGFLGVQVQDVDRDLAEAFGLDRPVGALVVEVLAESPAERGGMLPGDVVLEVNGKALSDANSLPMHVGQIMPGEEVRVTVARDRTFITLKFKLAETPDSARAPLLMDEESQALPARAPSHPSGHAPLPRRG